MAAIGGNTAGPGDAVLNVYINQWSELGVLSNFYTFLQWFKAKMMQSALLCISIFFLSEFFVCGYGMFDEIMKIPFSYKNGLLHM